MRRILYVSTMSSPMGDAELEAILEVARAHNDAQAITGLRLVIDDVFIQVLEGAGDTLNQLVAKIGDDPRHRDMTIVSDIVIETRDFSGWSMGFERMSLSRLISQQGFADITGMADVFKVAGFSDLALDLMSSIYRTKKAVK